MKNNVILILCFALFSNISYGRNNLINPSKITNTSFYYGKSNSYNSIEDVFRSFNHAEIKNAILWQDNQKMIKENEKSSIYIKSYLKEKYNIRTDEDGGDSPEATLIFGLFQYGKEKGLGDISENDINAQGRAAGLEVGGGDPFGCLVGAIGSIIGLGEVRSLYNDYMHGATPRTILKTLKTIVRRVGSVFTVISAVYSFGDCLNWW